MQTHSQKFTEILYDYSRKFIIKAIFGDTFITKLDVKESNRSMKSESLPQKVFAFLQKNIVQLPH